MRIVLLLLIASGMAIAADLPPGVSPGVVTNDVKCAENPAASYALYLPKSYAADKTWPVIFLFDPGGRGAGAVGHYQAAAEKYGYILAGSNNSRNGARDMSPLIVAMINDVSKQFAMDRKRIYTGGMSGGARVALGLAISLAQSTEAGIAGVMASSAGYPDGQGRTTLPFPLFMTAGTEDFNHSEMRGIDRELKSTHRLAIFEGGHMWLPPDLAMEALEWMDLQAMKAGTKARDEAEIGQILTKRSAAVTEEATADNYRKVQAIVSDFTGLRDVSAFAQRAAALEKVKGIRGAISQERKDDDRETAQLAFERGYEEKLAGADRNDALNNLRAFWKKLSETASKPADSPERQMARRVLSGLAVAASEGGLAAKDPEYGSIVREYRPAGSGRGR